ncbi:MAG: hypothetical protein IT477_07480 [Rhodanobacteraceae bacterium]|nr:hypothetical protein [Rhodanobacteraceae bacterium]MDL1868973.1 hypothetical protein [Gammaproteobacteria bacterium PRO6]
MRELRPGAPLVNELGDVPYVQPAARTRQTFEDLRIARIIETCGYLALGYATEVRPVAPDHPHALAACAAIIKAELTHLRQHVRSAGPDADRTHPAARDAETQPR